MLQTLEAFVNRVWPGIEELPLERRRMAAFDILGAFYAVPLALAGVVWLAWMSDWSMLLREWALCLALLLLLIPLSRFTFFVMTELRPGMTSDVASSLDGVVAWTAALLLGPVGLWLGVVPVVVRSLEMFNRDLFPTARWSMARNELVSLAENTLSRLVALEVYLAAGGSLPFPGFTTRAVLAALFATLVLFFVQQLLTIPLYAFLTNSVIRNFPGVSSSRYLLFLLRSTLLLTAGMPFAILAAGMYAEFNLWLFLFYFGGLVMVSYLANQLSRAMMRGQQQARLLEGLESLGRGLLMAPPNEEALLAKVREHISTGKLPMPGRLEIRLFPQRVLVHEPQHWEEMRPEAWDWLRASPGTHFFKPGEELPWGEDNPGRCTAFLDIEDQDNHQPIGGIFHAVSTRGYIDPEMYRMFLPVLESLADQVALAVRRAQIATQMLAHQRVDEELRLAGDIQGSFLPARFPDIAGWKLSAILTSARDTSGDYFDFINLPDGRVAIIEADVADKGVGAALYMALSRAYLRSQAIGSDPSPAQALTALNRRILQDTTSDLFVTVFYALVTPDGHELVYANAGHPPPIIVRADPSRVSLTLPRTGMAVGVLEDTGWEQVSVELAPGDFVVIYSDGMTDSMNPQGEMYGAARIKAEAEALRGYPPVEVRKRLIEVFQAFASSGQEDDVTLLVLGKD